MVIYLHFSPHRDCARLAHSCSPAPRTVPGIWEPSEAALVEEGRPLGCLPTFLFGPLNRWEVWLFSLGSLLLETEQQDAGPPETWEGQQKTTSPTVGRAQKTRGHHCLNRDPLFPRSSAHRGLLCGVPASLCSSAQWGRDGAIAFPPSSSRPTWLGMESQFGLLV